MNDRELLEMTAKAAGIKIVRWGKTDGAFIEQGSCWSPLTDDGDALRLAANLRLEIIPGKHVGDGCSVNSKRHQVPGVTVFRDSKDMAEKIRRAVVMCAAEIGRNME